ncbi:MAG TPA: hypothetical protein VGG71_06635 [Chitinophagaceae bacterium]
MKKIFFLIVACTLGSMVFAQDHKDKHVPESVRDSYQKDHPDYKNPTWDMKNDQWHTRYTDKDHGNRYVDVYYDKDGKRIQSRSKWDHHELPEGVRDQMRKRYHASNYTAYRIDRPEQGIFFQLSWGNKKVNLDEQGNEVKYH